MSGNRSRFSLPNLPPGVVRIGGRFTPGTQALLGWLVLSLAVTSLWPAARHFALSHLVLRPAEALGPRPYQLVTGPLLQFDLLSLIFTAVLLYSIGSAVEQLWGTRRYLLLVAKASLAASLTAAVAGRLLGLAWPQLLAAPVAFESAPLFMASLACFGVLLGEQQTTLFGVGQAFSVRFLSLFFLVLALVMDLLGRRYLELLAAVAAALVGYLSAAGPDPFSRLRRRLTRAPKPRPPFTVLEGGRAPKDPRVPQNRRWVN